MKYTKEQRLDIDRRIYYSEISRYEAAEEYGISEQTARNYMRMYRDANRLPPKRGQRSISALSFKKEPAEVSVKFSSVIHLTVDDYYLRGFGFISISV